MPAGAKEPSGAELNDLVRDWVDKTGAQSVVIQGEGDPLAAQDVVVETLRLAQGSGAQFRLNTLGVGATDAIFDALALVETVSVFLPAAEASKYDELLQPREPGAFEDACTFVRRASAVSNVEVTAVDRPDVDVAAVGRRGARHEPRGSPVSHAVLVRISVYVSYKTTGTHTQKRALGRRGVAVVAPDKVRQALDMRCRGKSVDDGERRDGVRPQ